MNNLPNYDKLKRQMEQMEQMAVRLNDSLCKDGFDDSWRDVFVDVVVMSNSWSYDYDKTAVEKSKAACLECLKLSDTIEHFGSHYQQNRQYLQENINSKFWIYLPRVAYGAMIELKGNSYAGPHNSTGLTPGYICHNYTANWHHNSKEPKRIPISSRSKKFIC